MEFFFHFGKSLKEYGNMEVDVIGLFALLVGLELILGADNILVIAILVSRQPESTRNLARNIGLALAMGMRILMVFGGLWLIELTDPVWSNGPGWFAFSIRDLA
jgi:predicted tellurium resistance membrane protein TerC